MGLEPKAVIVIVRWYIKDKMCEEFKKTWINMKPDNKEGLFRELFSKPTDEPDDKYHTLDFENKHYTTYINVGIWRSLEDFNNAINNMIPGRYSAQAVEEDNKENKDSIDLFKFEFKLRERIVMNTELIRAGGWSLPTADIE